MRKLVRLLLAMAPALLLSLFVYSQQVSVRGTIVSDRDNTPLQNASISVKGTKRGTATDANGVFILQANKGDVLIISSIGYQNREVPVGDNLNPTIRLQPADNTLEEVVVALDQKRKPRELGFANQQLKGQEIAETQRENFLNSLQGRIAGATVTGTSGAAGAGSQIVLRGFNSLSLDNQPLFVLDGIILDNSTINESGGGAGVGGSMGLASAKENRGNDYTNRIADINPNDIESITVLKGPEATALYGSQASSGAIVITSKKGKNTGRVNVNYDNSFRFQKFTRLPESIGTYSSGTNGLPENSFSYFGPPHADGVQLYDNTNNFFRTGFGQTHNVAAEYGKENYSFRFSGSFFDQQSPVPANTYRRYNLRISNTTKIGKYIEIIPAISYIQSENEKPLRGASGYLLNLLAWPSNDDVRIYEDSNGLKKALYAANPNAELDNPFYNVYNNRSGDQTDRIIATFGININPFKWLSVAGRFGYDTYHTDGYTRYDSMSFYLTRAQKGAQDNYYRDYYGYNHTITATARKKVGDFSGRLMIGNMWQDYETQMYAVYGTNLKSMTSTDSNNTDPATRTRLLNAFRNGKPNYEISRQSAYFGEAALNWRELIYLSYSHRFEESSIFPPNYRKYNYPAGSLSMILSDMFPGIKKGVFDYVKLRGSVASTARSSKPYANQSVFIQNTGSGGGYTYGFTNNNYFLQPEKQQTFEIGTEFRMLNNKLSFDVTYYNTKNDALIAELFRTSYGTGFVLNTINVGGNQNQGVEIVVDATPVQKKDFRWNIRFNFSRMWNEVTALPANVPEFYVSDTWIYGNARGGLVKGGPTTSITSYGYARNNAGQILIDPATGIPILDQNFRVRSDRNPDFTLGTVNNFSYKNWRLSFLWDLKVGGDIFNATDRYLTTIGKSERTQDRMTPRVVKGVIRDGLENTNTPTQNTISIIPYYSQTYFTTMPEEEFMEKDVNWLRLRDITLSYTFPTQGLSKVKFVRSLSVFITGNDLILFTNYSGADPAVNAVTAGSRGVGGFGFDYGSPGMPVSWMFGLRASF